MSCMYMCIMHFGHIYPHSLFQLCLIPNIFPFPLHVFLFKENPLRPIKVAHICRNVGTPTGAWSQWSHVQRKVILPHFGSCQLSIAPQLEEKPW